MKFGREYEATLEQDQYPQHWIQCSISYRQLKKCIRKIQQELSELGLDTEVLRQRLAMSVNTSDENVHGFPAGIDSGLEPRLVFLARMHDGDLVDATLSGKTKETLMGLARKGTVPLGGIAHPSSGQKLSQQLQEECLMPTSQVSTGLFTSKNQLDPNLVRIEVPLKNNTKFFQILQHGLSDLNALHSQEKTTLRTEISDLGQAVSRVAHPARDIQRTDLYAWRAVFSLYLDCNIFFSTTESEDFNRSPADVRKQLQLFSSRLEVLQETNRFRRKESGVALQRFLLINITLLRNLKFQHLNMRAAGKILKKFDKRTSLSTKDSFSSLMEAEALSPQTMAKLMCAQMSNEVLAIVPQLNDYLCPVCFSVSHKPIRLGCGHVFCIRCMVVMQRSRQTHCPLCRGDVVMQADSGNLDLALMNFLKTYFPAEVKQKQKENERSSGIDRYGSDYEKCALM